MATHARQRRELVERVDALEGIVASLSDTVLALIDGPAEEGTDTVETAPADDDQVVVETRRPRKSTRN